MGPWADTFTEQLPHDIFIEQQQMRDVALTRAGPVDTMARVTPSPTALPRAPRCPTCGAPVAWRDNTHRPFCSLVCRLIDLGAWLDERYRVEGERMSSETASEDRMARGDG